MPRTQSTVYNTDPSQLLRMMEDSMDSTCLWTDRDFASILRHQMAASVVEDLGAMGLTNDLDCEALSRRDIRTFGDLLHHEEPPVEWLIAVKDFAKKPMDDPDRGVPKDVAMVLYFGSIVVAQRKCSKRITQLAAKAAREGVEWVLRREWLDEGTRGLFE